MSSSDNNFNGSIKLTKTFECNKIKFDKEITSINCESHHNIIKTIDKLFFWCK